MESDYKRLVESAGAEFVAVRNGTVFFLDPQDRARLSLYVHALRSIDDVHLALKNHREPALGFEPLLPASID
jgi:hypothetical protein